MEQTPVLLVCVMVLPNTKRGPGALTDTEDKHVEEETLPEELLT